MRVISTRSKSDFERQVSSLDGEFQAFRLSVDRLFGRKLTRPHDRATAFSRILLSTAVLYVSELKLREAYAILNRKCYLSHAKEPPINVDIAIHRELSLRARLRNRLESLEGWSSVVESNVFAVETRLFSTSDYIDNLSLHLP